MIRLLPAEMAVNPKKSAKSILFMIRLFSENPFKRSCYENKIGLLRIEVEKQVFISNRYRCILYTEGSCLMRLLGPGKSRISQNSH